MTLKAHKIQLVPNNKQAAYFAQASGVSRFAYNWALAEWQRQYEAGDKPSEMSLRKQLNGIKQEQFPWMLEVTKCAPQQAIKNLGVAFNRFFKKQGKYPKFKKKGIDDSFRADNGPAGAGTDAVLVYGKRIKLARIGWVRMTEQVRFAGQIKSVIISKKAGKWFASLMIDTLDTKEIPPTGQNQASMEMAQGVSGIQVNGRARNKAAPQVVGVDLGITKLAVLSTGEVFEGPKALRQALKSIRFLNKELSRRQKGSKNWAKTKAKLAKAHYRVGCIRNDSAHKLTTYLTLNYDLIGLEDLNVSGMMKNHHLSRAIADQGFGEIRRQVQYKADWYGSELVVYPRFRQSSSRCCLCDEHHDMPLSKRVMACSCGNMMDRDLNAAINIRKYTVSTTVCGDDSAGFVEIKQSETMSVKQEANSYLPERDNTHYQQMVSDL